MDRSQKRHVVTTMTGDQIWNEIAAFMRDRHGDMTFNLWFGDLTVVGFDGETLALGVPNAFRRAWLIHRYLPTLQEAMETTGCDLSLDMVLLPEAPSLEISYEPSVRVLTRAAR